MTAKPSISPHWLPPVLELTHLTQRGSSQCGNHTDGNAVTYNPHQHCITETIVTSYLKLSLMKGRERFCVFLGCLMFHQHTKYISGKKYTLIILGSVTHRPVANFFYDTFYSTLSQFTDIGPTSPSTDAAMLGTWQASHQSASFLTPVWTHLPQITRLCGLHSAKKKKKKKKKKRRSQTSLL